MYLMLTIGCYTNTTSDVEDRLEDAERRIGELEADLANIQKMVKVTENGDLILGPTEGGDEPLLTRTTDKDVIVTNSNLFVVNGENNSASVNSRGNLIIGYNEPEAGGVQNSDCETVTNSGSHNLIIGPANSWTSWGTAVVGLNNCSGSPLSAVIGTRNMTTSDFEPADLDPSSGTNLVFGADNGAIGQASAVIGGNGNTSVGMYDVVVGGTMNVTSAPGPTYYFGRNQSPWPGTIEAIVEIGCADSSCTTTYNE